MNLVVNWSMHLLLGEKYRLDSNLKFILPILLSFWLSLPLATYVVAYKRPQILFIIFAMLASVFNTNTPAYIVHTHIPILKLSRFDVPTIKQIVYICSYDKPACFASSALQFSSLNGFARFDKGRVFLGYFVYKYYCKIILIWLYT